MVEFDTPSPGEWVQPVPRGYLLKCCDCGLVHRLDFRVLRLNKRRNRMTIQGSAYKVQFRAYREDSP